MPVPPLETSLHSGTGWGVETKGSQTAAGELYGDTQLAVFSLMHRKDCCMPCVRLFLVLPTRTTSYGTTERRRSSSANSV
jgi:hypothetical protein